MTTLKCDLCEVTAQGETFEQWMQNLMPHYMEAHADFIKNSSHTEEDKRKWMVENKARFDAA
jgi:predicted RNase H-like HicB family nuclease